MKRPAIDKLVYKALFPQPKQADPSNFHEFLARYLILEVRQEVHSFYGHLDTQEAKYPGLDYSRPAHRMRLSRWPWHRRLFRAFDKLGLTPAEIAQLTKWEGTKWAKERYEKEQNIVIRDTAADDMPDYRECQIPNIKSLHQDSPAGSNAHLFGQLRRSDTAPTLAQQPPQPVPDLATSQSSQLPQSPQSPQSPQEPQEPHVPQVPQVPQTSPTSDVVSRPDNLPPGHTFETLADFLSGVSVNGEVENDDAVVENDDNVVESIGLQLREQLQERVAAHNAGDTSQCLDEDWEQWLKAAIEAGDMSTVSDLPFMHTTVSVALMRASSATFPGGGSGNGNGSGSSTDNGNGNSTGTGTGNNTGNSNTNGDGVSSSNSTGNGNGSSSDTVTDATSPALILEAAQQGYWERVPPFLHRTLHVANLTLAARRGVQRGQRGQRGQDDVARTSTVAPERDPSQERPQIVVSSRERPQMVVSRDWRPYTYIGVHHSGP